MNGPLTRRELLALLAGTPLVAAACGGAQAGGGKDTPGATHLRVDTSFAELVARHAEGDGGARTALMSNPGLAAIVRHMKMSGRRTDTRRIVGTILSKTTNAAAIRKVLQRWQGRRAELTRHADAAITYLPGPLRRPPTLYLVAGYDIGFAAPPDVALNAAHPRFINDPDDIGPYLTHEVHHVGFMELRGTPPLRGLRTAAGLRKLVVYMTQLEVMGVHAAYEVRRSAARRAADPDYRVYDDDAIATATARRYAEVMARIPADGPVTAKVVGEVLTAMSSGERLWYRVGALACHRIEQQQGRAALVASIGKPADFEVAVTRLMPAPKQRAGSG